MLIPRGKDFNPRTFLANNLFCPSVLVRTKKKTNADAIFFTLGQLNILRKLAIIYGNDSNQDEIEKIDISKALLGAQDIHNEYDEFVGQTGKIEDFYKFALRNGYLNSNTDSSTLFFRAKKIYVDQSNKLPLYPDKSFNEFFIEKVGLSLEEAISLNFALVTPFFQAKEILFGQTAILPANYFGQTNIDPTLITSIIDSMAIDFATVKKQLTRDLQEKELGTIPVGYDLSIFRKNPIIRLSDGRLICANLACLLEKSTQNTIWMTTNGVTRENRQQLIHHLTHYRGLLFEEYLKELCSVMVEKNDNLSFIYIPPEATSDHEEVGDSILIQENEVIIFEAKSRQFLEIFKSTGDWETDPTFIGEFIKAAQQIEKAANKIKLSHLDKLEIKHNQIEKIYPVIVTYESVPMHGKIQRFIRQKVQEAGYLTDAIFAPIEVIIIDDIENSIDAVDTVSLIDLLKEKNSEDDPHASESNFHNFFNQYLRNNTTICNGWQSDQVRLTDEELFRPFFEDKFN